MDLKNFIPEIIPRHMLVIVVDISFPRIRKLVLCPAALGLILALSIASASNALSGSMFME
jgi:hypothetical protein